MSRRQENLGTEIARVRLKEGLSRSMTLALWSGALGLLGAGVFANLLAPPEAMPALFDVSTLWLQNAVGAWLIPELSQELAQAQAVARPFERLAYGTLGTFAAVSAGAAFFLRQFFKRVGKQAEIEGRGMRLVTPDEAQEELSRYGKNKGKPYTEKDLYIGKQKLRVPEKIFDVHLGVFGASGTGKSSFIRDLLCQRRALKEKVLIVDPGGEYYARFGRPQDVILSLSDRRTSKWVPWAEKLPTFFLARALVDTAGDAKSNKFFNLSGRALLAACLRIAKTQEDLWALLNLPIEHLKHILKKEAEFSAKFVEKADGDQATGVVSSSVLECEFFRYLNHHVVEREKATGIEETPFSINSWVHDSHDDRWVFLIEDPLMMETVRPLFRLWLDIAIGSGFRRDEHADNVRLWVINDEITTTGEQPSIPMSLDKGRKYFITVVQGGQDIAQFEALYGAAISRTIITGSQVQVVFRCPNPQTAEELSQMLGSMEIEEYDKTASLGEGSDSLAKRGPRERRAVAKGQLQNLGDFEAYIRLPGINTCKVDITDPPLPPVNRKLDSEIVERSWIDPIVLQKIAEWEKRIEAEMASPGTGENSKKTVTVSKQKVVEHDLE